MNLKNQVRASKPESRNSFDKDIVVLTRETLKRSPTNDSGRYCYVGAPAVFTTELPEAERARQEKVIRSATEAFEKRHESLGISWSEKGAELVYKHGETRVKRCADCGTCVNPTTGKCPECGRVINNPVFTATVLEDDGPTVQRVDKIPPNKLPAASRGVWDFLDTVAAVCVSCS